MAVHRSLAEQVPLIMTDASCDLPPPLIEQYGIGIIPPSLHAAGRPPASVPLMHAQAVAQIREVLLHASTSGRPLLVIVLSSKLGRTFAHAQAAAQELLDHATIAIVDSRTTAGELGLQALVAARAAYAGRTIADILPLLRRTYLGSTLLLCQDDIARLEHNEQMRLVSYRVAKTLGLKLMITISKGGDSAGMFIASRERPRSLKAALDSFERGIALASAPRDSLRVLIAHGDADSAILADMLAARLHARFERAQIETFPASVHNLTLTGPHMLSVAFIAGDWPV